jgi:hypothetical protein
LPSAAFTKIYSRQSFGVAKIFRDLYEWARLGTMPDGLCPMRLDYDIAGLRRQLWMSLAVPIALGEDGASVR